MPHPSQLPPLEARLFPEPEPENQGFWWRGCGLAVLVILIGGISLLATVGFMFRKPRVNPWPAESAEEKQQNLRAGFSLSANSAAHPDQRSIERFLAKIAQASSKPDPAQFHALVNFDALFERVLADPRLPKLSTMARFTLRSQLSAGETGLGAMARLRLLSLQTIDAEHVVAYTVAEEQYGSRVLWRLWLVKQGTAWQLADWEQVDMGMPTSERIAVAQAAFVDPLYLQYQQSDAHVSSAKRQLAQGQRDQAATQLRLAAACQLSAPVANVQRYLIMTEWSGLHDRQQVIQLGEELAQATAIPGVHHHLASAYDGLGQWEKSLAATIAYERLAGFQPHIFEYRARALEQLQREPEALALYEQLQQFAPHEETQLAHLFRLLPAERKGEWIKYVAQTTDPVPVAVRQASSLLSQFDDPTVVQQLEKFVAEKAPQSPAHLQLQAILLEDEGKPAEAAKLFLQALKAAPEQERQSIGWHYLSAMHSAGQARQALSEHPDPDAAFEYFASGFVEDESVLTGSDLQSLVSAQLARRPDHALANYITGVIAQRTGNLSDARTAYIRVTQSTGEDDEYLRTSARSGLMHLAVEAGHIIESYESAADKVQGYSQLAQHALTEKDWKALAELQEAVRGKPTAVQNAWFHYYEARLAAHAGDTNLMHEQLRLAKSPYPAGEKNPGASYLEYLENDFLANQFDLLEAYRRHSNPKAAFQAFHARALTQHDWQAAAELRTAHAAAQPSDPQLLAAESTSALQQGHYDRVIELLQPWPAAERFEDEWTRQQARDACVISLVHRQRLEEALAVAKDAGTSAPQLVALVHLVRGDAEALAAWIKQYRLSNPALLVHVADSHRREFTQARQNDKLAELLEDVADYPHDDFTNAIVLLSGEAQPASVDALRARLAKAIPGTQLGEPVEHETGTSYVLTIPGTEHVQFQLTVGKGPYATDAELREQYVLPVSLRTAVQEHKTWLALEMTEPEPASAADAPWKLLRQLAAALCNEQTLAVGRSEPHVYHCEFVVASPRLPELLRDAADLRRALAEEVSAYVAFAGESQAVQPPAVKQQVKLWLRKLKAGETVAGEVKITAKRGHRRESVWLRVVGAQQGQYGPHQIVAEPLANHPLLPAQRYRLWPHEIREVRATTP